MEFLSEIFQDRALTCEEFIKAFEADGRMRLVKADAESGDEPGRREEELLRALQDARAQVDDWKMRYEQARKEAAVDLAILQAGGRNVKAIRALLDLSEIQVKADGTLEGFSLEEISLRCGFSNYVSFWKQFKKHTGVEPSAYDAEVEISR